MEIILYLRKRCKSLISHGMPMSLLQREDIFTKIIAIKYDVPNNKLEMFDQYKNDIDEFYTKIMEKNA